MQQEPAQGQDSTPTDEASDAAPGVDVDEVADAVVLMMDVGDDEQPSDFYVWSDGSVSDTDSPPADTYLVSLFHADDGPFSRGELVAALDTAFVEAALADGAKQRGTF